MVGGDHRSNGAGIRAAPGPGMGLMGIELPDNSGLAAARQIRPARPHVRVIAISNNRADGYRQPAVDVGGDLLCRQARGFVRG